MMLAVHARIYTRCLSFGECEWQTLHEVLSSALSFAPEMREDQYGASTLRVIGMMGNALRRGSLPLCPTALPNASVKYFGFRTQLTT